MRQFQILYGYRGERTQEQFIPAGVYDEDDPRLYSLGDYLVANGHALEATETTEETDELSLLTVSQLKALADARGIEVAPRATKAELIAVIEANSL